MPFIKKTNDAILSWDAFPEPPPEAKDWKPNPDDVAKPRELKDPRLNRNIQEDRRRAASKRDERLGKPTATSSRESSPAINNVANAHPAWSNYSAQTLHSSQSASAPPSNTALPVSTPSLVVSPSQGIAGAVNIGSSTSHGRPVVPAAAASTTAPTFSRAQAPPNVKGSKETLPITHEAPKRSSATCTSQPKSESPSKSSIPPWAGPLEKLLAEGMANEHSSTQFPQQSSPPSHLRKTVYPDSDVKRLQLQPQSHPIDLDAHYRAASEASRRVSSTSTATIVANEELQSAELESLPAAKSPSIVIKQALKPQKKAPLVDAAVKLSADYQRYLDIAAIKFMEGELDLGSHGTKAQLLALDDDVFKQYYEKMKAAHKKLWISEKLRKRAPDGGKEAQVNGVR